MWLPNVQIHGFCVSTTNDRGGEARLRLSVCEVKVEDRTFKVTLSYREPRIAVQNENKSSLPFLIRLRHGLV